MTKQNLLQLWPRNRNIPQSTIISKSYTKSRKNLHVLANFSMVLWKTLTVNVNHDNEPLKEWKKHYTTFLNRITSGDVSPPVDEMATLCNMRIRTVSRNKRKITSAINTLKPSKAARLKGFPANLFIAALSWESEREWKKAVVVNPFGVSKLSGICVPLPRKNNTSNNHGMDQRHSRKLDRLSVGWFQDLIDHHLLFIHFETNFQQREQGMYLRTTIILCVISEC